MILNRHVGGAFLLVLCLNCSGGVLTPSGTIEFQGRVSLLVAGNCDWIHDDCDFIQSCELVIDGRAVGRRVTHSPPLAACEALLSGYSVQPGTHRIGLRLIAHTRQAYEYELTLELTAINTATGEVKFINREGLKSVLQAGGVLEYTVSL